MDPQGGGIRPISPPRIFSAFQNNKKSNMQIDAELAYYWVNTLFLARDIVFCQILVEISEKWKNIEMCKITDLLGKIVFMARGNRYFHFLTEISKIEKNTQIFRKWKYVLPRAMNTIFPIKSVILQISIFLHFSEISTKMWQNTISRAKNKIFINKSRIANRSAYKVFEKSSCFFNKVLTTI